MHQAPLRERLDFYCYASAEHFLAEAQAALVELLKQESTAEPYWKYDLLWIGFFVTYSKPFKQARDKTLNMGIRLPDDVVPPQYADVHRSIIDLRDKMFVHTDFASFRDNEREPMNALAVHFIGNGSIRTGHRTLIPGGQKRQQYLELVRALSAIVTERKEKILGSWSKNLDTFLPGIWHVNISDTSDDVLVQPS